MKFWEFIKKQLSEDNGNPSSMRTNIFILLLQWSPAITFGFIWVILYYPFLILEYLAVLVGALLAALGIKGWQKKNEADVLPVENKDAPQP